MVGFRDEGFTIAIVQRKLSPKFQQEGNPSIEPVAEATPFS